MVTPTALDSIRKPYLKLEPFAYQFLSASSSKKWLRTSNDCLIETQKIALRESVPLHELLSSYNSISQKIPLNPHDNLVSEHHRLGSVSKNVKRVSRTSQMDDARSVSLHLSSIQHNIRLAKALCLVSSACGRHFIRRASQLSEKLVSHQKTKKLLNSIWSQGCVKCYTVLVPGVTSEILRITTNKGLCEAKSLIHPSKSCNVILKCRVCGYLKPLARHFYDTDKVERSTLIKSCSEPKEKGSKKTLRQLASQENLAAVKPKSQKGEFSHGTTNCTSKKLRINKGQDTSPRGLYKAGSSSNSFDDGDKKKRHLKGCGVTASRDLIDNFFKKK